MLPNLSFTPSSNLPPTINSYNSLKFRAYTYAHCSSKAFLCWIIAKLICFISIASNNSCLIGVITHKQALKLILQLFIAANCDICLSDRYFFGLRRVVELIVTVLIEFIRFVCLDLEWCVVCQILSYLGYFILKALNVVFRSENCVYFVELFVSIAIEKITMTFCVRFVN